MSCTRCGAPVEPGQFCQSCGTFQPASQPGTSSWGATPEGQPPQAPAQGAATTYGAPSQGYGPPGYGPPAYGGPAPVAPVAGAPLPSYGSYGPPPGTGPGPPGMSAPGQYMPYQPAYPAPQRTNGMAIASLICSLAGLFCGFTAVLGVIFGFVARGQIRRSGGAEGGSGLALAGIVIGLVVCALIVVWILVLTVGGVAAHTTKTSLGTTGYWGTWA